MKNVTSGRVTEVIDHQTGEIIQTETVQTFQIENEPPYFKVYIKDVCRLQELNGRDTPDILYRICAMMGFKNMFLAYKPVKQAIADEIGCTVKHVENVIIKLKKKGILVPVDRAVYVLDPELFGKGKWKDIRDLRLNIEYKEDGTKQLSSSYGTQLKLEL